MHSPHGSNTPERTVRPALREVRLSRRLSQQRLADLTRLDRSTLSRIENGRQRPHPSTRRLLAAALGCDVDALFEQPKRSGKS